MTFHWEPWEKIEILIISIISVISYHVRPMLCCTFGGSASTQYGIPPGQVRFSNNSNPADVLQKPLSIPPFSVHRFAKNGDFQHLATTWRVCKKVVLAIGYHRG